MNSDNFETGDRVYFTGPPEDQEVMPGMPFDRETHRLYNVPGTICIIWGRWFFNSLITIF